MASATPMTNAAAATHEGLLVQIASYNTNLQGNKGVPQDLVDWLSPTLLVSNFLARPTSAPDIVAVGFEELLPLHRGFTGLSHNVMRTREALVRAQLEAHAPNKAKYVLLARAVYVGIALLVFARDDGVARRVSDVQTQWTGCGPAWMGNKGAVGVRFVVRGLPGYADETFTFVNAHLTAHARNARARVRDWAHIVQTLLFRGRTLYDTSHVFVSGDLNFRLQIPRDAHVDGAFVGAPGAHALLVDRLGTEEGRAALKEYDELLVGRRQGIVCQGLREGEFWRFKCSYKFAHGEVDVYRPERTPSWTDRIMFSTYSDSPQTPEVSAIKPIIYTTIPSYVTSDHKPIVALLQLPPAAPATEGPPRLIQRPAHFHPDQWYSVKRWIGKTLGWVVGWIWSFFWLLGAGYSALGVANVLVGLGAFGWWRKLF